MDWKYKIIIPLTTKSDILWHSDMINVIGVNQLYTWGHITWRKRKRLTPEAVKYKNYLKSQIELFREKNWWFWDYDLKDPIFYTVTFYLTIPTTKDWKINERYIRDVDNLLKPLQDSLESDDKHKRIWSNDKQIRCLLATIEYNVSKQPKIEINLYKYNPQKIRNLLWYIDKTF